MPGKKLQRLRRTRASRRRRRRRLMLNRRSRNRWQPTTGSKFIFCDIHTGSDSRWSALGPESLYGVWAAASLQAYLACVVLLLLGGRKVHCRYSASLAVTYDFLAFAHVQWNALSQLAVWRTLIVQPLSQDSRAGRPGGPSSRSSELQMNN